jgi:CcmD family protein
VTNEWSYITAAYALTWLTLGGYALYLWRRARRAERALALDGPTARGE